MDTCTCGAQAKPMRRSDGSEHCGRCFKPMPAEITARKLDMRVSTTDSIVGFRIVEHVGLVTGAASTTGKHTDDTGGLNKQEGRMAWAIQEATARMVEKAAKLGANAIVGVTLAVNESEGSSISVSSTGAGVMGTAVTIEPQRTPEPQGTKLAPRSRAAD